MPKIQYLHKRFGQTATEMIDHANKIIDEYLGKGFRLTVRQLYYQFVSRDLIANQVKEYKRLAATVSDARLAGLIDWQAIEDRGRNLMSPSTWASPSSIIDACAWSYKEDLWKEQPERLEVWVEKEALSGVMARACDEWRVPYFACKGYTSQSEMWDAGANRFMRYVRNGQTPVILHLGDHDPSGLDMTRDIRDRLEMFMERRVEVKRLALNMDQVEEFGPPPNPAKMTDTRAKAYVVEFGAESWELDALPPDELVSLIQKVIVQYVAQDAWDAAKEREEASKKDLELVSSHWNIVKALLKKEDGDDDGQE